ncbi:MAG: hypothetical protein IKR59_01820 [Lachnospiraceae bacterium]|nr:hypothetical protein [Lachnospiraceae bacterium]
MKKFERIGALAGIVLLASMYIVCLITAVSGSESLKPLFRITLAMTVAVPILLYAFILLLRLAAAKAKENHVSGSDAADAGISDEELEKEALSFGAEEEEPFGEEKHPSDLP